MSWCGPRVLAAGLLLAVPGTLPAVFDTGPYLSLALEHDDNVYRFADEGEAEAQLGADGLADQLAILSGGGWLGIETGLQRLRLDGSLAEYRYRNFSDLDRTEHAFGGRYDVSFSRPFTARLGYSQSRALQPFTRQETVEPVFQHRREGDALVSLAVTPRWTLRGTGALLAKRYSTAGARNADLDEWSGGSGLEYRGAIGALGLELVQARGRRPERTLDPGSGASTEYRQRDAQLRFEYKATRLSTLDVRAGYTRRDTDVAIRDFSGLTGRLRYARRGSAFGDLHLEAFRQLFDTEEADASFVRRTGGNVGLAYHLTPATRAELGGGLNRDDYVGDGRQDRIRQLSAAVAWSSGGPIGIRGGVNHERRTSTAEERAYASTMVRIAAEMTFD